MRQKFKPFPKKKAEGKGIKASGPMRVDVDKLYELYLQGPDLTFRKFCIRQGFNPQHGTGDWYSQINLDEWKREWLRRQCNVQDEEAAPELLEARALVSKNRSNFVKDWNQRAVTMKKMHDFLLNMHLEDMRWDMVHTLEIQAGRAQRRCNLEASEWATICGAAERLQALEAKSLMLMPLNFTHETEAKKEDRDGYQAPQIEYHTMGAAGMRGEDITKLMANYFDQFDAPKPEEEPIALPAPDTAG